MRAYAEHLSQSSLGDAFAGSESARGADGCAGGSCGAVVHFRIEVDSDGVIVNCGARVRGQAAAFAAASALCEAARNIALLDAASLGVRSLHPSFAALTPDEFERALVAEDAFHHAIGRWVLSHMRSAPRGTGHNRPDVEPAISAAQQAAIVVGMSGGVDSAVALHRLIDQEQAQAAEQAVSPRKVVGATLRLWIDPRAPDPEAACCSPDSVRRARATCHAAGMPHLSIDLREQFTQDVVAPFVAEYAAGGTPNPCVRCNGQFRLDELVRLADVLGAKSVATGHYARVVKLDGVSLIKRGVDPAKDQSYMLGKVQPATVERLCFPLGESVKVDVRADASRRGLKQATISESQEVCFLGGGDYRSFLDRANAKGTPGDIVLVDEGEGERVVGRHDGVAKFTPGQRRGIGVSSHAPLYVLDVDPESGRVLVGHNSADLQHVRVAVDQLEWYAKNPPSEICVQLRYRARDGAIPARVLEADSETATAVLGLAKACRAPAPGQAAILYDHDGVVVASARIARLK